jgi:hypothetical protein
MDALLRDAGRLQLVPRSCRANRVVGPVPDRCAARLRRWIPRRLPDAEAVIPADPQNSGTLDPHSGIVIPLAWSPPTSDRAIEPGDVHAVPALDGCPLGCVEATLRRHDIAPDGHLVAGTRPRRLLPPMARRGRHDGTCGRIDRGTWCPAAQASDPRPW